MRYESIADIYSANVKFRDALNNTLTAVSADEATALPEGEKWSIEQIAEHLSMVDFGISRICAKLLEAAKADGTSADGSFSLSANFSQRAAEVAVLKVEAPERVQPTGNVSISEAIESMAGSRKAFDAMNSDFESLDFSAHTFPHPFFGDLTAGEWLVMSGIHQHRHTKQIETLLTKIRQ
jgi:hypothetical protein